jgi:hypothetical protein
MAIFSENFVTAKFLDSPNNMTIEVLYEHEGSLVPYIVDVDFSQDDFTDLLKEISLEEIEKITKEDIAGKAKSYHDFLAKEVDKLWEAESAKIKAAYEAVDERESAIKSGIAEELRSEVISATKLGIEDMDAKDIFYFLQSKNVDFDFVFNTKVAVLEVPQIAQLRDKDLKLRLRKAKSFFEVMHIFQEAITLEAESE